MGTLASMLEIGLLNTDMWRAILCAWHCSRLWGYIGEQNRRDSYPHGT